MTNKIIVLVMCGSIKEAKKIARALVEGRIAACVNIITAPVQSVYRWQGSIESVAEFLLIIKTTGAQFAKLKGLVKRLHSYDVTEIIALRIASGAPDYLNWISDSVRPKRTRKKNV